MSVNVSATFKKDEREYNGLEAAREEMIAHPLVRRMIVATIEVTTLTTDVRDGGTVTPTVRLVNVEVLGGDDAITSQKLLDVAYQERTGQVAPPPTLFDEGVPGQDAATHNGDEPPWDEQPQQDDEGAAPVTPLRRSRRKS